MLNLDGVQVDFQVTSKNKTVNHTIEVCIKINDNCFGIGLIHKLGISFNGATNTLYAITKEKNAKEHHPVSTGKQSFRQTQSQ